MANTFDETVGKIYATEVASIPVGLAGMILTCKMVGSLSLTMLDKVEAMIGIKGFDATLVTAANTGAAAWLTAKFLPTVIGNETARLISAMIVAEGGDKVIGALIDKESKRPLSEILREQIEKMAPGLETQTTQVPKEGYTDIPSDFGYLLDTSPSMSKNRIESVVDLIGAR